uniref:Cupin domain-containing protein n=1 Tax=Fervidobacterium pennivorans TaxID=93466 RepID=A0A7V4NHT7_FERPE
MKLGSKLKRLRLARGYTQEELADRCDLSRSFISQLESDKVSPSVETLERILRVLGTDLKHFFSDEQKKIIFKKGERVPVYDLPKGVNIEILMDAVEDKELDAKIVELEPGAQTEQEGYHDGDEFGYVIEGSVDIYIDGKRYRANEGDCFYYSGDCIHYMRNPGKEKAKILWIQTI